MAFAERLKSGRYRGGYRKGVGKNRKKYYIKGTFRLESEAKKAAQEAEVIASRQVAITRGTLPATIAWGDWWDIIADQRKFDSDTEVNDRSTVKNYLRPHWGKVPLVEIDRLSIKEWIGILERHRHSRGGRLAASSIRKIYGVFTASINKAIEEGVLTSSPLVKITLPRVPKRKAKSYLAVEDRDRLITQLRDHPHRRRRHDDHARVIDFGLETGLRPGEIAGLHDDQIDKRLRVLIARTVYVRGKKKMRDIPKDGDEREIPLTDRAWEIYCAATEGRDMSRPCGVPHVGGDCPGDVVFRTKLGRILNTQSLWKTMRSAAAAAGLPRMTPYSFRRGYATRLALAGADVFTLMELMGHESVEQTHGYVQRGAGFDDRVRAALDLNPHPLRLVGSEDSRGTVRGTEVRLELVSGGQIDRCRNSVQPAG